MHNFLAPIIEKMRLYSLSDYTKMAQIVQGIATPIIAFWIGRITSRIQRQQVATQTHQAETQHLQHRFALMEKRMKVFDATMGFIVFVLQTARMDEMEPLFKFMSDTREHHLLFGSEIGEFINKLYSEGARLHAISGYRRPDGTMRPEDIKPNYEIIEWFSGQTDVAREKFAKYIDFRKP
jgi:hypothetical protein